MANLIQLFCIVFFFKSEILSKVKQIKLILVTQETIKIVIPSNWWRHTCCLNLFIFMRVVLFTLLYVLIYFRILELLLKRYTLHFSYIEICKFPDYYLIIWLIVVHYFMKCIFHSELVVLLLAPACLMKVNPEKCFTRS